MTGTGPAEQGKSPFSRTPRSVAVLMMLRQEGLRIRRLFCRIGEEDLGMPCLGKDCPQLRRKACDARSRHSGTACRRSRRGQGPRNGTHRACLSSRGCQRPRPQRERRRREREHDCGKNDDGFPSHADTIKMAACCCQPKVPVLCDRHEALQDAIRRSSRRAGGSRPG